MSSLSQYVLVPIAGVLSITARHAGIVVCVDIEPFEAIPDEVIAEMYMEFPTLKSDEWILGNGVYVFIFESDDPTDASEMYAKVGKYLQRKFEDSILDRF